MVFPISGAISGELGGFGHQFQGFSYCTFINGSQLMCGSSEAPNRGSPKGEGGIGFASTMLQTRTQQSPQFHVLVSLARLSSISMKR